MTGISAAQKAAMQIDIAAMPPGFAPEGFTFWRTGSGEAAEWRVVADPSAAGQKAIAQTSKDTTDYRFPLAVYQPVSAKNVDVVVRFKPVAGTVDQAGGIAVRLTTPDDYYVVRETSDIVHPLVRDSGARGSYLPESACSTWVAGQRLFVRLS